jgi:4-amino-4-deoxy-L-arabinose transferase-like glycosyltransferase
MRRLQWLAVAMVVLPMLALALYPPTAFDETLYHLPLVRAIAEEGLGFHEELRFPVFPLLAELLAVPAYLLGGDVATHAIPLIATLLTAAVLLAWGRLRGIRTGALAVAAFLGAPIVVHLATSLYVEAVLTLFVCAGFYCLEFQRLYVSPTPEHTKAVAAATALQNVLGGLFLGAACAVKYLGLYFAVAGAVIVAIRARRALVPYLAGVAIVALPMYAWIYAQTGNPLFPYFAQNAWTADLPPARSIVSLIRIPFDVVFARDRIGQQPPFTPFFALALIAMAWKSRARFILPLGYLLAFLFLPADARYLVPLLPLVLIEGATVLDRLAPSRRLVATLTILAIVPGPAYAIYRIAKQGSPFDRTAYLRRVVPEYRALERAGTSRVYACRGEQLKWYAAGPFLGDHFGPHSFSRVLNADMQANLRARRIDHLLVARECNSVTLPAPGFTLVYADEAAQLWRVGR